MGASTRKTQSVDQKPAGTLRHICDDFIDPLAAGLLEFANRFNIPYDIAKLDREEAEARASDGSDIERREERLATPGPRTSPHLTGCLPSATSPW